MEAGIFEQTPIEDFQDEIEASKTRKKPKNKNIKHMQIRERTLLCLNDALIQLLQNQKRLLENQERIIGHLDKCETKEQIKKKFEEIQ